MTHSEVSILQLLILSLNQVSILLYAIGVYSLRFKVSQVYRPCVFLYIYIIYKRYQKKSSYIYIRLISCQSLKREKYDFACETKQTALFCYLKQLRAWGPESYQKRSGCILEVFINVGSFSGAKQRCFLSLYVFYLCPVSCVLYMSSLFLILYKLLRQEREWIQLRRKRRGQNARKKNDQSSSEMMC